MPVEINESKLAPQARKLLRGAVQVGWTARNTANGGVIISAPRPNESVSITLAGQVNDRRYNGFMDKIIRYGDQMLVALAAGRGMEKDKAEQTLEPAIMPDPRLRDGEPVLAEAEPAVPEPDPAPEASTPVIVWEGPWKARRGNDRDGARYYDSQTTIERKWSDGSVDYRCAKQDCDYTAPMPRSVVRHFGMSKDHPTMTDGYGRDTYRGPAYEPGTRKQAGPAASKLAREIEDALRALNGDAEAMEADELAAALAQAIVQRRAEDAGEAKPAQPLTAEQILSRIRNLVDDGSYFELAEKEQQDKMRIAGLEAELVQARLDAELERDRVEEVREQRAQTDARLKETEARLAQLQTDLLALPGLLQDIVNQQKAG